MIHVENLTKRYGAKTAVDNLSFSVAAGEIVGFLGPNGAGKTTTLRILTSFLPPTGGRVRVAGFDVLTQSLEVRRRIGYLPENVPLYQDMRVRNYLRYRGELKGLRGKRLRDRLRQVLADCGLDEVRDLMIGRLSKGFRQRVGLADSLLHEPELLILDEPTIGLDPNQIRHIRNLIKSLAQRHTVFLSSHILPEVEMICQRVLIINRGRIVTTGRPEQLADMMQGSLTVTAEIQGPREQVVERLAALPGVRRIGVDGSGEWHRVTCECDRNQDIRAEVFRVVAASGWVLRDLRSERQNLEDVFVALTAREVPLEKQTPAWAEGGDLASGVRGGS